jgi:hypothetical protein
MNDQFYDTSLVLINCISPVSESKKEDNLSFEIYDLLGKKTKYKENSILIYKYSNGITRKILTNKK